MTVIKESSKRGKSNCYLQAMLCVAILFSSCVTKTGNEYSNEELLLSHEHAGIGINELSAPDTIATFRSELPVDLLCADTCLFAIFGSQSVLMRAFSLNDKSDLGVVAVRGNGPQELSSPMFMRNPISQQGRVVRLHDTNGHCMAEFDSGERVVSKRDLTIDEMNGSSMNFDGKRCVYRPVYGTSHFFNINNAGGANPMPVAYPFGLSGPLKDMIRGNEGYFLAPNINANFVKDRIIASMYFADAYYVYDCEGNLLSIHSLSSESCDFNDMLESMFEMDNDGIARYVPGYATDDYCYLRRVIEAPNADRDGYEKVRTCIVKVDWDGNVVGLIAAPDCMQSFCVDDDGRIIAIIIDNNDAEETYRIVRYDVS